MDDFGFFMDMGVRHILNPKALDHSLFLMALLLPFQTKDWKKVLFLVTAFTIGHSLSLALFASEIISLPKDWIEFMIALSIALMAVMNLLLINRERKVGTATYLTVVLFGLIHGAGFSNDFKAMFSGDGIVKLLFGFNLGVEIGQLIFVLALMLILFLLGKINWLEQKYLNAFFSGIVLVTSLLWCVDRFPL